MIGLNNLYYFSGFELNTTSKELKFNDQHIELTNKTYDLLLFLLQHPQQVHSKDELLTQVWQGRVVSGNTIDQTVLKLRKALQLHSDELFVDSIYAQGIKWVVAVEQQKPEAPAEASKPLNKSWLSILLLFFTSVLIVSAVVYLMANAPKETEQKSSAILLQLDANEADWEIKSASQFLQQLLTFSSNSSILSTDDKPMFVLADDFVKNQQKLIPDLTLIKIKPLENRQMAWLIEVTQNQQTLIQTTVEADDFQTLIKKSTDILVSKLNLTHATIQGLLPDDKHVMALYVRGLKSLNNNQLQKAHKQFSLAIDEQPGFHLARLKLAETLDQLGQYDTAITVLDTLTQLNIPEAIEVAAATLKMRIYKVRGEYRQAAQIYTQLTAKQLTAPADIWQRVRYDYAAVLQYLNQPSAALAIYDAFIEDELMSEDVALLADVRAEKASLLQKQGDVSGAQFESEQALKLFESNQDAIGTARTYSVLARIANQKAQYPLAEQYLRQALTVTQSVGHKLGQGAVLNELIYALMRQGKHNEAWQLTSELLAIGSELDYAGMQLAAYQAYFEMSRIQRNWQLAERWLNSYQQLAQKIKDERRIAKAQLFQISLLLDRNLTADVADKITAVQNHIIHTDEKLMQAALNVFLGRYQWLTGQHNQAIETLIAARTLALELEDYESLITANNHLAQYYLSQEKPQLALNTLTQSAPHQPFAIPYLRLKATAELMLKNNIDALATITACKQQAPELWGPEEQALLTKINQAINPP